MLAINWKTSWPIIEQAVKQYNEQFVNGTKKNGKPRYELGMVLRSGHEHLLKEMVRAYSRQLMGYPWLELNKDLPPYRTHCGELSRMMRLCKATIQNQLNRLLESGFITEKEHQGRKNRFLIHFKSELLELHPELLKRRELVLNMSLEAQADNQLVKSAISKTLAQVIDTSYSNNKENKLYVDCVENAKRRSQLTKQSQGTGYTPLQDCHKKKRRRGGGANDTPLQETAGLEALDSTPPRPSVSAFFQEDCVRLMAFIVGGLYQHLDYLAQSQLEAIEDFLASQFEGKSKEEGQTVYHNLWIRIGLAEKWLNKKPGRFIPVPSKYFDPNNQKGFEGTKVWQANMRMTNDRAEKSKQRFQYISRSFAAVLQSTGRHLSESGIHSYTANREKLVDVYPHLGTAFDWLVLDPKLNSADESDLNPK